MTSFDKTWTRQETQSMTGKIRDAVKPQGALKPRIQNAVNKLQVQISKMDSMLTKLRERDQQIFQRIVTTMQQHDTSASKVLSNELAEIRKVSKILGNARMALEQIELRLTTAHDLGDTVVTIMPTIGLMKNLKSSLSKFMPGAEQEINNMAEMLGGLMTETFSGDATFGIDESTNAESDKILQEAAAVAETAVDDKFPNTPMDSEIPSTTSRFM